MPKRVQKRVQIKQETHKTIKNQRDNYKDDSCRDTIYQFAPIRTSPQNPLEYQASRASTVRHGSRKIVNSRTP